MYGLILESRSGRFAEAVVLTQTADTIRLFVRGCQDAIELRRVGDDWIDEAGEPVALAFITSVPEPRPTRIVQSCLHSLPWVELWEHIRLGDEEYADWTGAPGPRPGLDVRLI